MVDDQDLKFSVCAGCGAPFVCAAVNGQQTCWCMEKPRGLFEPLAGDLCYCPECLAKRISEAASPAA